MIILIKIISIYLYIIIVIMIIIIIKKSIYFKIILIYKYIYKIKLLGFITYDLVFVWNKKLHYYVMGSELKLMV